MTSRFDLFTDQHARAIILQRLPNCQVAAELVARVTALAGRLGYYRGYVATLDESGAWCVRDGASEQAANERALRGLTTKEQRKIRALLALDPILADRTLYLTMLRMMDDGTASGRHLPRAHADLLDRAGLLRVLTRAEVSGPEDAA